MISELRTSQSAMQGHAPADPVVGPLTLPWQLAQSTHPQRYSLPGSSLAHATVSEDGPLIPTGNAPSTSRESKPETPGSDI